MTRIGRSCDNEEQEWLGRQEQACLEHLESRGVRVGEFLDIEWSVAPILAIWSVRDGGRKYWVICGDVPIDHLSHPELVGMRGAMKAFAERWRLTADFLLQGKADPTTGVGEGLRSQELVELGGLLVERARLLQVLSSDEQVPFGRRLSSAQLSSLSLDERARFIKRLMANDTRRFNLTSLQGVLQALTFEEHALFGTVCAKRCLAECRLLSIEYAEQVRLLDEAVAACRRRIQQGDLKYGDLGTLHQAVGALIPEAEVESVPPQILIRAAYAVCEMCMIFQMPEKGSEYAALVGAEVVHLRRNIYSKGDSLTALERDWQLRLIEQIRSDGSLLRNSIEDVAAQEDYDCGECVGWDD